MVDKLGITSSDLPVISAKGSSFCLSSNDLERSMTKTDFLANSVFSSFIIALATAKKNRNKSKKKVNMARSDAKNDLKKLFNVISFKV